MKINKYKQWTILKVIMTSHLNIVKLFDNLISYWYSVQNTIENQMNYLNINNYITLITNE